MRTQLLLGILGLALLLMGGAAWAAEERYAVYFHQSSVALTDSARGIVKFAADDARAMGVTRVRVVGYADTADMAPVALSRYRADAVVAELRRAGLPAAVAIDVTSVGATQLKVPTGPDVHEPYNRRVTISY